MGDEYKAGKDEIAKAMAEIQTPAPEVETPKEEPKEKPAETPTETTESKQEPQLEEKKEEVKTEPTKPVKKDNSVPLIKFIQEEKRRKQLEKELEEIKNKPAEATPQKLADVEQRLYDFAVQNKWTQEQYDAELAKTRAIYEPIRQELDELKGLKEQAKATQEQKEVEAYVDSKIAELDAKIEKEHGDNSALIKAKLKEKILKEGLETVPIEYVYNGDNSFRAPPQKKTIEPSRGGKSDVIDINNPTPDDIKSGRVDAKELLQRWKNS